MTIFVYAKFNTNSIQNGISSLIEIYWVIFMKKKIVIKEKQ